MDKIVIILTLKKFLSKQMKVWLPITIVTSRLNIMMKHKNNNNKLEKVYHKN
jgi:hypothetical protein